ncbi:hypothetical protein R6Q59_007312 [Mikania micrantha]
MRKILKKLTESWHEMMGYTDQEYRTYHQLCSKWKDMSAKLMRFSGIYSNCANNRKSGMNDEGVLKWTEKEYRLKSNVHTFNHYHVWVAIKEGPKFNLFCQEANEGQSFSKRSKNFKMSEYSSGCSDAHTVNLELDEEDDEFEIQELVRPVGRDMAKQASSSSHQTSSSIPTTNELAHQLTEFTRFQKTKHEDRLLRADLKVMGIMPPKELGDEEREIMRKLRAKIFDRYR